MLLEGESSNIDEKICKLTQAKPNRVQNNKKERENGGEEGGGPTICHNILLPSKGSNKWRNIPFFKIFLLLLFTRRATLKIGGNVV